MFLKENYNSASQKYGKEMAEEFLNLGLPPKFLLSACRFKSENNLNSIKIVELFRKWMTYVLKYEKIDVNKKSFDSFLERIKQGEILHIVPNILWYNSECSIGSIDSLKVARSIPVENVWCIKARDKFQRYASLGHKMYIIYSPNRIKPYTYIIAQVHNGEVDYWDMMNHKYSDSYQNDKHKSLENTFPKEIINILYNESANQTENKNLNCNRIMKTKKKVIRLTESNLRSIIAESVKKVLNETTQSIWRNVPNTQFMYHGEWSDPEIIYKGHELNANDVEDYIYNIYKEECEYNSVTPSEDDYEEWIKEQGVSWLKSILDNLI